MPKDNNGNEFSLFGNVDDESAAPLYAPHYSDPETNPYYRPGADPDPRRRNPKKSSGEIIEYPSRKQRKVRQKEKPDFSFAEWARSVFASSLKPLAILGAAIVIFAVVAFVVNINSQLNEKSSQISDLQSEIDIAKSENVRLTANLQSLVSIDKVEDFAENELGMIKLESYKITYFDDEQDDRVVISGGKEYRDKDKNKGVDSVDSKAE